MIFTTFFSERAKKSYIFSFGCKGTAFRARTQYLLLRKIVQKLFFLIFSRFGTEFAILILE